MHDLITTRSMPLLTALAVLATAPLGSGPAHAGSRSSRLASNPAVVELVDAVSADSLRTYLEKLVGFHTRHSNSAVVSSTIGIGAARRWIFNCFDRFAEMAVGNTAPSYFEFDANTCGVDRFHKNVVMTLTGSERPGRYFITSGHMDSRTSDGCDATSFAPGADDDGSGTVATMECARVMSRLEFESSVQFIAFTGEEQGRKGSIAYARWLKQSDRTVGGMITNDIVGNITGCPSHPSCPSGELPVTDSMSVKHFSQEPSTGPDRQFARSMRLAAERYMSEFIVTLVPRVDRPWGGGDHEAFNWEGMIGVRFSEPAERPRHSADDDIKYIDFNYLARITRVNVAGLANMALAPDTPSLSWQPEALSDGRVRLRWVSVTGASDLAGYRVALRGTHVDSLFYFDIRDAGLDVGAIQEYELSGLAPDTPVNLSVSAYDADGNESRFSDEVTITPTITGIEAQAAASAATSDYLAAVGSASGMWVTYRTETRGDLRMDLYDVSGRLVTRLFDGPHRGGRGSVFWNGRLPDGRRAGSGVFFVRMTVDEGHVKTIRTLRLR